MQEISAGGGLAQVAASLNATRERRPDPTDQGAAAAASTRPANNVTGAQSARPVESVEPSAAARPSEQQVVDAIDTQLQNSRINEARARFENRPEPAPVTQNAGGAATATLASGPSAEEGLGLE